MKQMLLYLGDVKMNIVYIREAHENGNFTKRVILKIKGLLGIINVEKKNGKILYYLPILKKQNINKGKIKKISKKIVKKLEKDGINNIALSKYLNSLKELKNNLYSENITILNGRHLFKCLAKEIIEYILKIKNEGIHKLEISILINECNEFNQSLVMDLAKEVRTLNIITNHINKWSKIEENLYNNFGILLNVSNNKSNSLKFSKLILNIDFPSELINQYKMFNEAIIINTLQKVNIKNKKFNGININYFKITIPEKYKLEGFTNEVIYESIIHKKGFNETRNIIKNDKIKIKKLIGNSGYIKENEFNTKHLTKVEEWSSIK